MRTKFMGLACVALLLPTGPAIAKHSRHPTKSVAATPAPAAALDLPTMHAQVILDHLGFSPGVIDGRQGKTLVAALKGFQEARGLPVTGTIDQPTLQALNQYQQVHATTEVTLTADMLSGPFVNPIPHAEDAQAKLPSLGYRSPMEKLGEMFHTKPSVLMELNSPTTRLTPGAKIVVPNVVAATQNYDPKLPDHWRKTLSDLNVDSTQPQGAKIVVDKAAQVLRVLDQDGKLVAQFMVTTGSQHDPLPLGDWKINGADYNPKFHFNPKLFWDAKKGETAAMLPPGPNGPVGVVWLDLSKEHYGIHGTPEPQNIGRTESHGCIRMTNWDAARLSMMVKAGTPAHFQS